MGFRFRLRKSFTLIPRLLKFTINRQSWSLNFTLGPYSRSWGSARSTSALDAPGHLGLSWRKEHDRPGDGGFSGLIMLGMVLVLLCQAALLAVATWGTELVGLEPIQRAPLLWVCFAGQTILLWPVRTRFLALLALLFGGTFLLGWLALS